MRFLLLLFLFFMISTGYAQQFTQYNTGTLFNSFENPGQRAFIPDSSRQFASNFFFPNLGATGAITGNASNSFHSLITKGIYNSTALTNGLQNQNNLNVGFNTYWFMLKMYAQLDGDQEIGLSAQTKVEGAGSITDETLLLLDSYKNFNNGTYNNNLFNDQVQAQAFHQLSLTFRQKISPAIAFGVKLSALLGIYYNKIDIQNSSFYYNQDKSRASLYLKGNYSSSYNGQYTKSDILGLRNPGAAVSLGMQVQLENGVLLEGNVKDLGFIRWNKEAVTYLFNNTATINNIATASKSDQLILTKADSLTSHNGSQHAFYSATNSKAELAISKKFNLLTTDLYYTPTFIVSKNLFYNGLTAALVNHFTFKSLWLTALASYNDNRVWNGGAQVMVKSPNAEFYVGTEQLFKSAHFFNANSTTYNSTGINAYLGFSAKFGRVIEHPANASYIPMGEERGFFNRMWTRIFKRSYN